MSKPLIANPKRQSEAAVFHREVFRAHGKRCWCCGRDATDAAHIIPRSKLGPKMRYAIPKENGRPACRKCHEAQESGIIDFPLDMRRAAVKAHNSISKIILPEPQE